VSHLVDVNGRPMTEHHGGKPNGSGVDRCPRCNSSELERIAGFGGHWQTLCSVCGCTIASGRKEQA